MLLRPTVLDLLRRPVRLHAALQVAAHSIRVPREPQARLLQAVGRPLLRGIEKIDGRMIVNVEMITSDVMIIDSGTTIVHAISG